MKRTRIAVGFVVGLILLAFAHVRLERILHAPPSGWLPIRPPHDIHCIAIHDDTVWAGGKAGVWRLDRRTGRVIESLAPPEPIAYVRGLAVDTNGVLWIGHSRGVTRSDGKTFLTITSKDGLPDNRVNTVTVTRDGRVWVGTWSGCAVYDGTAWKILSRADGLADDMVNVVFEDSRGGVWMGSYVAPRGGISVPSETRWHAVTTADGLPHSDITSMIQDCDGGVWVGTGLFDRGGAAHLVRDGDAWRLDRTLTKADGLAGEKVRSLLQTSDGMLWFGSEYDGLTLMQGTRMRILGGKDGLVHPEIKCMVQDRDGNVWMGTRDGLMRVDAAAVTRAHSSLIQ